MHRFWAIPELLLVLIPILHRNDAARLGQVCWCFFPLAAEFVWEEVNFRDILRLLHPNVLRRYLGELQGDGPCRWNWPRFRFYAGFVKSVAYDVDGPQLDALLTDTIQAIIGQLPNVQSLRLDIFVTSREPGQLSSLMNAVLLRNLLEAIIVFHQPLRDSPHSVNRGLRNLPRSLKVLTIRLHRSDLHKIDFQHVRMIEAHPKLRELSLQVGEPGLGLRCHFPELLKLDMKIYREVDFSTIPPDSFPSLVHLNLEGSTSSMTNFIGHAKPQNLVTIGVNSRSKSEEGLGDLVELITTLPSLINVHFGCSSNQKQSWENLVAPLMLCRRLQNLQIERSIPIDDLKLKLMAEAWPNLQSLRLRGHKKTRPTLAGLCVLPQTLRRLEIAVNTKSSIRSDLPDEEVPWIPLPNMQRVRLSGEIRPYMLADAVGVIRHLWPNLVRADAGEGDWAGVWERVFRGKQPWVEKGYFAEDE